MLKENWRLISRVEKVSDLFIILFAFLSSYYVRPYLIALNEILELNIPFSGNSLAPLPNYCLLLIIAFLTYAWSLHVVGAYGSMRRSDLPRLLYKVGLSSCIVFLSLASAVFLLKLDLSRSFIIIFCTFACFMLTAERYLVLWFLRYWRRRGRNFRNVLICGTGQQALKLTEEISNRPEIGLGIIAFADLDSRNCSENEIAHLNKPILCGLNEIEHFVNDNPVDEVIFTDIVPVMDKVEDLVHVCSERGIRTTIVADMFSIGMVKSDMSYFGSMPLIHFQTPPGDRWELALKRLFDVAIATVMILVLSPAYIFCALAIKATSKGPILYKHKRVGLNGRLFSLYKFRSMYFQSDANEANKELSALRKLNEMTGPVFKLRKDPRVTRVGAFLRRYSIDEIPQLWNVLRGDMSIVGPRPPIPNEVSMYSRRDRRRLSMRPGLTCTWQVSGRNNIKDFESWVKLDLEYIDNWSLLSDMKLILKTIPAVISGYGAS